MQGLEVKLDTLNLENIRELYENIVELAESLEKTGQQVPIVVGKLVEGKRQLFDGHRRVRAALLKGWTTLKAIESDRILTQAELTLFQLVNDVQKEHLTPYERSMAALRVKTANSTMTVKQLDGLINMGESLLWKYLTAEKLSPASLEAFKVGKIGLKDVVELAKLGHDEQPVLLNLRLGGASTEQVRKARKKSIEPAVRTARLKVKLVSGQVVTVAGQDASLEEVLEALEEAKKLVKAAIAKGLNASTAAKVWSDMAAAG
jgi:ParB/RepB/Spo0J family partition protein